LNPTDEELENMRNSDSVGRVMVNRRLYDATTLAQVAPKAGPAPAFWWQRADSR
jgi:hypothetical protein